MLQHLLEDFRLCATSGQVIAHAVYGNRTLACAKHTGSSPLQSLLLLDALSRMLVVHDVVKTTLHRPRWVCLSLLKTWITRSLCSSRTSLFPRFSRFFGPIPRAWPCLQAVDSVDASETHAVSGSADGRAMCHDLATGQATITLSQLKIHPSVPPDGRMLCSVQFMPGEQHVRPCSSEGGAVGSRIGMG